MSFHVVSCHVIILLCQSRTLLCADDDNAQDILHDLDTLLGTDVNFLLGQWQQDALAYGTTPEEVANLEFNARNQLTLWGYSGALTDYAAKHWNGLVR